MQWSWLKWLTDDIEFLKPQRQQCQAWKERLLTVSGGWVKKESIQTWQKLEGRSFVGFSGDNGTSVSHSISAGPAISAQAPNNKESLQKTFAPLSFDEMNLKRYRTFFQLSAASFLIAF